MVHEGIKMKKQKNVRTRLNVDIDSELHKKLRILAIKRNLTLSSLVTMALIKHIKWEDKYK